MKILMRSSIAAMLLLSLAVSRPASAQTPGASASGAYKFLMEDGFVKYFEFDAKNDDRGFTTGQLTFTDEATITETDVDNPGDCCKESPPGFYIKADFDSLTVEKNRALLSGTVLDSDHREYIGRWVQLVIEDNGDGIEVPDTLTWSICRQQPGGWVPSDYEVKGDDGAYLSWWATDAELKDDVGIPSKNLMPGETKGCQVYPIWSYPLVDIQKWSGDILIR
ncbi:MAG: hypothetical protein ABR554_13855 [Pyrinomonadaceae bacterium]